MGFGRFSRWLWGDGKKGKRSDSHSEVGKGREWEKEKEKQKQKQGEGDLVVVTIDGRCLVGLDFEDSDWSIGWVEPHHPDFDAGGGDDGDGEGGFAVLVPFYKKGGQQCALEDSYKTQVLAAISVPEDKRYLEELLSSHRVN